MNHKRLCLRCAAQMQQETALRYVGKKTRMGRCSRCGETMLVTEYAIPDGAAQTDLPARRQPAPGRCRMELDLDARTCARLRGLAAQWDRSEGEVVDSLMLHFLRGRRG